MAYPRSRSSIMSLMKQRWLATSGCIPCICLQGTFRQTSGFTFHPHLQLLHLLFEGPLMSLCRHQVIARLLELLAQIRRMTVQCLNQHLAIEYRALHGPTRARLSDDPGSNPHNSFTLQHIPRSRYESSGTLRVSKNTIFCVNFSDVGRAAGKLCGSLFRKSKCARHGREHSTPAL